MKLSKAMRAALTEAAHEGLYGDPVSGRWLGQSNPACNALFEAGLIVPSGEETGRQETRYRATREAVRLLSSTEVEAPGVITVAEVSTEHFSFRAIGTSRAHARWLLELAWTEHARQYRADDWESDAFPSDRYDVRYLDGEIGATFRDGERLDS